MRRSCSGSVRSAAASVRRASTAGIGSAGGPSSSAERVQSRAPALGEHARRDADDAAAVAQVALDLTGDRGDRVGLERPARGVVAVDRVDQPDAARLDEVVERFAAAGEAQRERPDEREVGLDLEPALGGWLRHGPTLSPKSAGCNR